MAIPAKSKYVINARPGSRSGVTLFCAPGELPSLWTRIVLAEKDVDSARVEVVRPGRPHPDLMTLNPTMALPTLVDRDAVLYPAMIVAEYLDERYPHPRLLPSDPASRAHVRMLLGRMESEMFPLAHTISSAPKSADAKAARKTLGEYLIASAQFFPQRGWCLGLDFNLADCAWAALLSQLPALQVGLPAQATLQRYAQRLLARQSVQSVLA